MTPAQLADLKADEVLRARLAKWLTQFCFRNTELENFHDRLTDDEMKAIMKDSVNHTFLALYLLFVSSHGADLIELFKEADQVPEWDDPEVSAKLVGGAGKGADLSPTRRSAMPPSHF